MSTKRGKHQIDTTPNKYLKLSPSRNDGLNMLEYFILVAIVSFFVSDGLQTLPDSDKQMTAMFNNIVKTILDEENLMFLPVEEHSERVISRLIRYTAKKREHNNVINEYRTIIIIKSLLNIATTDVWLYKLSYRYYIQSYNKNKSSKINYITLNLAKIIIILPV